MIAEGVGPQDHAIAAAQSFVFQRACFKPSPEGLSGEGRHRPLRCHAGEFFRQCIQQWCLRKKIHHAWRVRGELGPFLDQPHAERLAGSRLVFVIVREKFRLVAGQIGVRRAVTAAAFAGKAEIERFAHCIAFPRLGNHFAA
jgi:hypothetical protein